MSRYKIDPFLYTPEEKAILKALITQHTPLTLSKYTHIPRSTVYFTLERLKVRGLVKKERTGKKYFWFIKNNETTDTENDVRNPAIRIYDSRESIDEFLSEIVFNDGERFRSLSGDHILRGWDEHIGKKKIIEFNKFIEKNGLITDSITSKQPLKEHIELWGDDWATSFKQKPTEFHIMDKKYSDHGAQIFIKNKKVFVMNINKPIVIEIIDPEISKMFLLMFEFIKDYSQKVNIGELLSVLRK